MTDLLKAGYADGHLSVTTDPAKGVDSADMIWICVGTPSSLDKGIDLSHIETVMRQIGQAMKESGSRPLIVLRSTVLPGSMESLVIPTLEQASGLKIGLDFQVVFHPEFLRESTAVEDFDNPPKIVIGEKSPGAGDRLMRIYELFDAPKFRISLGEAEMVKYCDNLFHAIKITFANEVGSIARAAGIDARKVAEVFVADTKLNISPYYLRPGFAFGGSCLPKDLRAILHYAVNNSLQVPLLGSTLDSNHAQIENLIARVLACKFSKIGMIGLSFKPNTDDMRESPYVTVAKRLIGEGIKVRILDSNINVSRLLGSNKAAVVAALGHLKELLVVDLEELTDMELIIINHSSIQAEKVDLLLKRGIKILDLVGIKGVDRDTLGYEGIAW